MKNIFLAFLFVSTTLLAQNYDKNWNKVIEYENAEKIKSANTIVEKIYNKAIKNGDEVQIIKCFFYKSKYLQVLEENTQSKIIENLKPDINRVSVPSKALLNLVYAKCLKDFLSKHSYELNRRTKLDSTVTGNFLTWTKSDFENEIEKSYAFALENEAVLKNVPLKNYEPIFDYLTLDKFNTLTLFDYLLNENINFWTPQVSTSTSDAKEFAPNKTSYLGDSKAFLSLNLDSNKNEYLKKTLKLFQKRESQNNDLAYQFERIKFCYKKLHFKEEDYLNAVNQLQKNNPETLLLQKLLFEKSSFLENQARKDLYPENKIKALKIIDSILVFKNNSNAFIDALKLKNEIETKQLYIEVEKFVYQNQNLRALVSYKNMDKVKISFYAVTQKETEIFQMAKTNKDSLTSAITNKKTPTKSALHPLIDKKDYFDYTTEILLPQLDLGNYLVYLESTEDKKTFGYEMITVTNLAVLSELNNDTETYYVSNRKTGKPIENASIETNHFSIKTNKGGIAQYIREKEKNTLIMKPFKSPIQMTLSE